MRITDRDRELLSFVAEHKVVLASHVQALLGTSDAAASARLRALSRARLLRHEALFERQPPCYRIARAGLDVIGSDLPPPRHDLRSYKHDIGLGWLWLAARGGAFGPLREVVSERRMRSSDAAEAQAGLTSGLEAYHGDPRPEPFAVRLGGTGPGGRERLHYPDLLLIGRDGRRVALELELTAKSRVRRQRILSGYAADRRIDAALYLVQHANIGRGIESLAVRLGVADRVHVRRIRWGEQRPAKSRGAAAERTRRGALTARRAGRARKSELGR